MAAADPGAELLDEATCSICRELYTDPVTLGCGHNFCLDCLTRFKASEDLEKSCPECRHEFNPKKELKLNKRLGNIAEILKTLQTAPGGATQDRLCEEHGKRLQLFCENDGELLCAVCMASWKHRTHRVTPINEAAQEYKKTLSGHKNKLSEEMEELQLWTAEESSTASRLEENYKNQTENITSTFDLVRQFLEKEKQQLLSQLKKEHEENMKKTQENLTKLGISQSTHRDLIKKLEEKCQQQDVDLLKDVKSIVRRCENVKNLKPKKDDIVEKALQSIRKDASMQEKLLELKGTFPAELKWIYDKGFLSTFHAELEWKYVKGFASAVTLDPDTAHSWLILSEDGRSVRLGDRAQDLPDTPQRFNYVFAVLGRERLSSGRHYWEVEVWDKTDWDPGVCDKTANRKGGITYSIGYGYGTVSLRDGKYAANTSPPTLLNPRASPRAVGLFLDYEAGRLSVYNVDDRSLLFTFSGSSFPPTLRPYFSPCNNDKGGNLGALRVLPVTGRE